MKTLIISAICALILFSSCKEKGSIIDVPAIFIYKYTNPNYLTKSSLLMNDNKSKIIGFSSAQDTTYSKIIKLQNNYILDKGAFFLNEDNNLLDIETSLTFGMNTAILDINRIDYENANKSGDSLTKHIIDKDPFIEYYYRDIDTFETNPDLYTHIDEYIVNGELVSKLGFIRLK